MNGCLFCALLDGKIPARRVYEDDAHVAFFPLKHIRPGHTLLIPRRHAGYVFDMDDAAYHALWAKAKALAPALREATGAARIGVAVEGFGVDHVHVHLVPINAINELNPEQEAALPDAEADALAARIRAALARG